MYGCIVIDKQSLDTLDDECAPPEDDFNSNGRTWVWMVSSYTGERTTRVGFSYVMLAVAGYKGLQCDMG